MNKLKNKSGITLIALVVTIIVLLILAGISIAMLTGDNGILTRAGEAKTNTDKAQIVEQARLDILAKFAEKKGKNPTEDEVKDILKEYFTEDSVNALTDLTTLTQEITTKTGGYAVQLSEVLGGVTIASKPLEIGDPVNYTTSLNGVTLEAWKVFYVDENYTYLILDGYLPNAAISSTMKSTYNLDTSGKNSYTHSDDEYNVYATTNRADLINAMTTKSNWSELVTNGKVNGIATRLSTSDNVWAMGSPTLDLWLNSWNASYAPRDILYTATTASTMSDGLNGYYIGTSANPSTTYISLSSKNGYNNPLYWISKSNSGYGSADDNGLYGYWLASPAANDTNYVMSVGCNSYVGSYFGFAANGKNMTLRPVVCLPSSVVNQ